MKKSVIIIALVSIYVSSCFSQQRRVRRPNSSWENVDRTLSTIDNLATAAYLLYGFSKISDYTGVRVGTNALSLATHGDIDANVATESEWGFDIGIVFGWYLGKSPFIIEPGIYFSTERCEFSPKFNTNYTSAKYRMNWVEVPVVFKYEQCFNDDLSLEPFAGGFMSFGVGGETEFYASNTTYDTFENDGLKSFDAGIRVGLGFSYKRFYYEVLWQMGFVNLAAGEYNDFGFNHWDDKLSSRKFEINVGLNF